jgi:transposase
MMGGCENHVGCMMCTGFPVSVRSPRSVASSAIPGHVSCDSCGGEKTGCETCGRWQRTFYDRKTRRVSDLSCCDTRVYLEVEVRRVHCRSCGAVKQEKLPWLANNPFYTERFAFYVGQRCRSATIRDVARELRLDWKTDKALEMEYMREKLRRAGRLARR